MNEKKHTLAKHLNTILDTDPPKKSIDWMGFALAAAITVLAVVSFALGFACSNERTLSKNLGQLHQTK